MGELCTLLTTWASPLRQNGKVSFCGSGLARETSTQHALLVLYTVEPLYCGHLGDLVKCLV